MLRIYKVSLLVVIVMLLVGCSSSNHKDIRQDIWDNGNKYYSLLEQRMKLGDALTNSEVEAVSSFIKKYEKNNNLTEAESKIINGISKMTMFNLGYKVAKIENKDEERVYSIKRFNEEKEKIKQYFTKDK